MDGNGLAWALTCPRCRRRAARAGCRLDRDRARRARVGPRVLAAVADAGGARRSGAPGGTRARGRAGNRARALRSRWQRRTRESWSRRGRSPSCTARPRSRAVPGGAGRGVAGRRLPHRRGGGGGRRGVAGGPRGIRGPRGARHHRARRSVTRQSGLGDRGLVLEAGRPGPSPAAAEAGPPHALRQAASEQPPRLAAELGAHGCLQPAAWRELLEQTRTEVASRVAGCSYF